jgi:hypothetical protein
MLPPSSSLGPRLEGGTEGNTVEPTSQRGCPADRPRFVGQDKEGGLKGILGVRFIGEDAAADVEHQRSVAMQDFFEGRLVMSVEKTLQQFPVRSGPKAPTG